MSGRDVKDLRKQLRNVVQEIKGDLVTSELVAALSKTLTESQAAFQISQEKLLNERLDRIENECRASLGKQDQRARAVQGFLVQSAMQELNGYINNSHVTMLAWQEVVGEKLGATEELNKEIDSRKAAIAARLQKEAEAKMAERTKAEEAEKSPEAEQPQQEAEKASA